MFFGSSLGKVNCAKFYHCRICVTAIREGAFLPPYPPAASKKPILSRVKVDVSNYATKSDFKNLAHVDTSNFALKTNLAGLKTEVDKLDIDKLVVKNSLFLLI